MYADEADQDGSREFLVYAAVFFPADATLKLHKEVVRLRYKYGFKDGDLLKFSTGTKPKHVDRGDHTKLKNDILNLATDFGCQTCCYVVPHSIAKGQDNQTRLKFGINTLLLKFDQFLRESGKVAGTVRFDHTNDFKQMAYFEEVFQLGMDFQGKRKKLDHIVSIEQTSIGLSHLSSIADIVVGSFRFVINEPDKDQVGALLFKQLSKLMWGEKNKSGTKLVRERGLCIRPRTVEHSEYEADIAAFVDRLVKYQQA
ncbi:MAG TPA: hypothetical protein VGP75_12245 [Yoonia sp.]|nr:hypothetical protein [Yoonia sp.]